MTMTEPPEPGPLDGLLAPFLDDSPSGIDLRQDVSPQSIYFRLRDARSEARAAERLADNDPDLGGAAPAQWSAVHELALEALADHSKDLEIACWLTEALTRRSGLAGLADGVAVIIGVIDGFWDQGMFPSPDPEDAEGRLIAISGMSGQERDGSLLQPLRKLTLFSRADGTPVTLWGFERSRELAALGAQGDKAQRASTGIIPFADLEVEARGAGNASLLALGRDALRAESLWKNLEATAARVAGDEAKPATGRVRGLLESVRRLIERYVPNDALVPPAAAPVIDGGLPAAEAASDAPKRTVVMVDTRDAMLDEIIRIAAAFRENEPNSPLSFTLEEAVRRARLPWPDLLRELMPDPSTRATVLTGAGVRPPAD
jgi:type VI secretion system protein ImpA